MIDGQGKLWVTDFGVARTGTDAGLTMTGDVLGTLRYMSPEQAMAKHGLVDHHTDLYSLGVTLYELLTGVPAVSGRDREEILNAITLNEPRPPRALVPGIPHDMETIVLKGMAKEPIDRYGTSQELADDLGRFLENRSVVASRPTVWKSTRKWARRHSSIVWATSFGLAVGMVALAAGTLLAWHAYQAEAKQGQLAETSLLDAREQRRQARQAVDKMYLQVADKWLNRQPQMGDLQKAFLQEVLHYYQTFAQEEGEDEESRFDRAKAYLCAGVILIFSIGGQQGSEARPYLLQANAILERLVKDFPNEPAYIEKLAEAKRHLAFTSPEGGEEEHRQSVALLEELVTRFPSDPEYRYKLALSLVNLANPVRGAGRSNEAEGICRRALKLAEELARSPSPKPGYLDVLANAATNLGEALSAARRWNEAAENYRTAIAAYQKLASDSSELPEYQHGLRPGDGTTLGTFTGNLAELYGISGKPKRQQKPSYKPYGFIGSSWPIFPPRLITGWPSFAITATRRCFPSHAAEPRMRTMPANSSLTSGSRRLLPT